MEKEKRVRKLSLQLIAMTVLLFVIGTAAGAVALYNGSKKLYLSAKDEMITRDLECLLDKLYTKITPEFYFDYSKNNNGNIRATTLEDSEEYGPEYRMLFYEYTDTAERAGMLKEAPEGVQRYAAATEADEFTNELSIQLRDFDYEKLFCIDISEDKGGFVYYDAIKAVRDGTADYSQLAGIQSWEYSTNDHPALEKLRKGPGDVVYETAQINSEMGHDSYIGYLLIPGTDAALCISYDWQPIQTELMGRVIRLVIVLTIAMLVSCILIMLFLRKVVVKPLSDVQSVIIEYMNDKDSSAAEERLKEINTRNEISALSDDFVALVREVHTYTTNTKKLTKEVMEALAHTIDAKDKYTNGHSFRVGLYSRMLAKELGLSPQEREDIYYMGLLHDIGKIGIPTAIINKTSRLTDEEYEIIKKHPVFGYEILAEIKSMPALSTGARYHHERIDGKGYPDGLKGDEIPYMARIIAVADSYDTMTSNRSYRQYLPQDVVREEIEKNIGTQFDEAPARAMLKIIDNDKSYMLHE